MMAKTHLAFGVLVGILVLPLFKPEDKILFFGILLIGALLPDVDTPTSTLSRKIPIIPRLISIISRHRGIFHSIWLSTGISISLGYLTSPINGIALFIGYFSHLISDGLTVSGINFFHPLAKLHLSGFIETNTTSELVLFIGLITSIALLLV